MPRVNVVDERMKTFHTHSTKYDYIIEEKLFPNCRFSTSVPIRWRRAVAFNRSR